MSRPKGALRLPRAELTFGKRTLVMGVVNVTPDSFSDGGLFLAAEDATAQGVRLCDEGADVIDVGGESTRPGSEPVDADAELARVMPVIEGVLAARPEAIISIDTSKAAVAQKALMAGAQIINDVTALRADDDMAALAAKSGAGLVLMHMQGRPRDMQKDPSYDDVLAEVCGFLAERADLARRAGVPAESIMIDPGIGFGKNLEHNLTLIRGLGRLRSLGWPVLLGASRKAMIGTITGRPADERLWGTVGLHVAGAMLGADMVRVHDVAPMREALMMSDAVMAAGTDP